VGENPRKEYGEKHNPVGVEPFSGFLNYGCFLPPVYTGGYSNSSPSGLIKSVPLKYEG